MSGNLKEESLLREYVERFRITTKTTTMNRLHTTPCHACIPFIFLTIANLAIIPTSFFATDDTSPRELSASVPSVSDRRLTSLTELRYSSEDFCAGWKLSELFFKLFASFRPFRQAQTRHRLDSSTSLVSNVHSTIRRSPPT